MRMRRYPLEMQCCVRYFDSFRVWIMASLGSNGLVRTPEGANENKIKGGG